jgi:hypothetical protein
MIYETNHECITLETIDDRIETLKTVLPIYMSDPKDQTTIIPHSQVPLVTRTYPSREELEKVILSSADAQKRWAKVPLPDRITIASQFVVRLATERFQSLRALNLSGNFQG